MAFEDYLKWKQQNDQEIRRQKLKGKNKIKGFEKINKPTEEEPLGEPEGKEEAKTKTKARRRRGVSDG